MVGRVQAIKPSFGHMFGVLRQPAHVFSRVKESRRRNHDIPYIELMLQYYRKHLGCNKFNYNHIDNKRIEVDCNISTMTISCNATNKVYTLDRIDVEEFVTGIFT